MDITCPEGTSVNTPLTKVVLFWLSGLLQLQLYTLHWPTLLPHDSILQVTATLHPALAYTPPPWFRTTSDCNTTPCTGLHSSPM